MGKAYTEEEREQIKTRIMEEGIRLFHENGNKALSIRELAGRVGISLGGFYSFFETKEDLVLAIAFYRSEQKTELLLEQLRTSDEDPVGVLAKGIYNFLVDMIPKVRTQRMYQDMIHLMAQMPANEKEMDLFEGYLKRLECIWQQKGYEVSIDAKGAYHTLAAACILAEQEEKLEQEYMVRLVEILLQEGLRNYIRCTPSAGREESW